jgi:purine nucleosidase
MMKIIIDCDNTFGVCGCDVDDGLAIIYALGSGRCEVLGITTTFGNNTLEVTTPNTIQFMQQIRRGDIPVFAGHANDPKQNKAAAFLVDAVNASPGQVSVLAVGSLTNLYHAWLADADFFAKVDKLSLMGGITEPLVIKDKQLNELNFSCNAPAAYNVLSKAKTLMIATGNNCLDALSTTARFDRLADSDIEFLRWMHEQGKYWFDREQAEYDGLIGIYKWDVYAAAALLWPELFNENIIQISPDEESVKTGMILGSGASRAASLPLLKDPAAYQEHIYEAYSRFAEQVL